jgi:hypothetical protein
MPLELVMLEDIPLDSDTPDKAVIRNQDLEHQHETYVSNKGVKVPPPVVDSPERRDLDEELVGKT